MPKVGTYALLSLGILGISWALGGQPYWEHLLFLVLLFGAMSSAWNIAGGYGGLISLGHAIYFGIGAYASSILWLRLDVTPWLGAFAGAFLSVTFAALIGGILVWRLRSHFFALATLAVAEIVFLTTIVLKGLTGGADGLQLSVSGGAANLVFDTKFPYIAVALVFAVVVTFTSDFIKSNKLGFELISSREDEVAAESLGVNTLKVRLVSYLISAFFVSLAGSIYAQYTLFVDPAFNFGSAISINMALFAIVGGISTVAGPLIGAAILIPLETLFRSWLGGTYTALDILINGLILIIVVLYFSGGLMDWVERFRKLAKARATSGQGQEWVEDDEEREPPAFLTCNRADTKGGDIILDVAGLSKRFGGFQAVSDIDLTVKRGEIVGLIGPNGAGKSTFLKMVSGVLQPDAGTVRFKSESITGRPAHTICALGLGRTFQLVQVFRKMTAEENIMVAGYSRLDDKAEIRAQALDVLKYLKLEHLKDELAGNLSGGQQKLLEMGRALMLNSDLYLLDEPFVGVHPKISKQIEDLIEKVNALGKTFIIISHDMKSIFRMSDRLVVLSTGMKIADGDPQLVRRDERVLEAYLGDD